MRLNNMVEMIRQLHPDAGRTQIIFDLNRALKQYAKETRILYGKVILNRTTDLISEDTTLLKTQWRLPVEVYEVWLLDGAYKEDYYLTDNILNIRFVNKFIQNMEVSYFRYPMALLNDSDEPEFSEEFHDSIVAKVLGQYYARDAKNLPAAQYWMGVYQDRVRSGKKHSNTRDRRNENPSIGGVKLITTFKTGLTLVQGVNTIPLDKTFSSVDSYAVLLNGNGVQVDEYSSSPTNPHADRTVNSFKVFAADPVTGAFDLIVAGN